MLMFVKFLSWRLRFILCGVARIRNLAGAKIKDFFYIEDLVELSKGCCRMRFGVYVPSICENLKQGINRIE